MKTITSAPKSSIQKKTAALVIKVAFGSVIAVGLIALTALWIQRGHTINVSGQLGYMAASDSRAALEQISTERLFTLTRNLAALSDSHLQLVQNSVEMIAFSAGEMLHNPDRYSPYFVLPPDPENAGVMTPQFLWAENSETEDAVKEAALLGNIRGILLNVIHNNLDATASYIGSEKGFLIIVDEDSHNKEGYFDPRERPWYRLAVERNGLIWTDIFADAYGRGLSIVSAAPFHGPDGSIAGVAGVGTLLDDLVEIVIGTAIGETGFTFVLNEFGHIILYENIEIDGEGNILREDLINGENPDLARVAQAMVRGESGIERIKINGHEYFAAFYPITLLPWSLGAVIEVAEVIAPALESGGRITAMTERAERTINIVITIVITTLLLMLSVIMFIVSLTSRRFANALTEPITALQAGVKKIAGGNLDHIINVNSGDEIEELGASVNKMAKSLKEYINDLQKVTADRERISAELNVAAQIQAGMLPCIFPAFPEKKEFDVYATMIPAKEVGGDFYDFFMVGEDKLAVVVADVSGKGIPAALFMVIAKTLLKNNAQSGMELRRVFEVVNNLLCDNNEVGMFVTVFMGVMDISTGLFTFVNAGHNPPLIRRAGCDYVWVETKPGFVLAGMEGMAYKQGEITLHKGDTIFMYTDGITEAVNMSDELFGDQRLLDSTNKYKNCGLQEFATNIKGEIDGFAMGAEQADDITMLVLHLSRGAAPTTPPLRAAKPRCRFLTSFRGYAERIWCRTHGKGVAY